MSTSTHPIIILSDSDVEDAFSSTNTPDYTPASPNYSPASPGNTFSDTSEDSSKDRSTSLTISPFHDDPYMKVMQAYNATSNESLIPLPRTSIASPTVLPPSPVFFRLERVLIRRVWSAMRNIIDAILNHLDELPLERSQDTRRYERRISTLELLIEDIQVRHRSDMKSLPEMIHDQEPKGGPPTLD
ncbi:hypothetical protein Tco_0580919 [Tanacetum coccineum]